MMEHAKMESLKRESTEFLKYSTPCHTSLFGDDTVNTGTRENQVLDDISQCGRFRERSNDD